MALLDIKKAQPKPGFLEKFGRALGTVAGAVVAPFTGGASLLPTIAAGAGIGGAAGGVVSSLAGKKKDGVGALNSALDGGVGALNAMDRLRQEPPAADKVEATPKQIDANSSSAAERRLASTIEPKRQVAESMFELQKAPKEVQDKYGPPLYSAYKRLSGGIR